MLVKITNYVGFSCFAVAIWVDLGEVLAALSL